MKANRFVLEDLDRLLGDYEAVVEQKQRDGTLTDTTARTYLLHARNFVRWCKGEFEPGGRNE